MNSSSLQRAPINLETGGALRLRDSIGKAISLCRGKVWITQQGDPRDIFLDVGQSFIFDRPGLALVQAVAASSLLLLEREPGARLKRPNDVGVSTGAP
jgi:hypothetical protein